VGWEIVLGVLDEFTLTDFLELSITIRIAFFKVLLDTRPLTLLVFVFVFLGIFI
jgi:hypothetical protein